MLRINKMADYATVILNCLCISPRTLLNTQAIADRTYLSRPTVSKILKLLQEAGLVISVQGILGGYCLSRSPRQINLAEVIVAIEGNMALTECVLGADHCTHNKRCNMKNNWQIIHHFICDTLSKITLEDMQTPLLLSHPHVKKY